jgi:glycine cleavage system H protein
MRGKGKAVLPCNGLDKEAGALAREAALHLAEDGAGLVCPVLYSRNPSRYAKMLEGSDLLVIDGCKTGCASKLAKERGLKLAGKLNVTEMLKELGLKGGKAPAPDPEHLARLLSALEGLGEEGAAEAEGASSGLFQGVVEMNEFMEGKFIFKVPKTGYFFNENDCWARVEGNRARLGVSDYVQQSASDMVFFEPPEVGRELEQFDDAGSLESSKTALDIISPVSGRVVAVNRELVENPELINQDPYVAGWAVEVELADLEGDRELLMDCEAYLVYLKNKVKKENEERYG